MNTFLKKEDLFQFIKNKFNADKVFIEYNNNTTKIYAVQTATFKNGKSTRQDVVFQSKVETTLVGTQLWVMLISTGAETWDKLGMRNYPIKGEDFEDNS